MPRSNNHAKRCAAVWIDHRRARIVEWSPDGPEPEIVVESEVEPRHKSLGSSGVAPPGHLHGEPLKKYERRRQQEATRFYRRVIDLVRDVDAVAILGPAQAPQELHKEMERKPRLAQRVVGVWKAQALTPAQLAKRTRELFDNATETKRRPRLR